MNTSHKELLRGTALALLVGFCSAHAGEKTTSSGKLESVVPKSLFVDNANSGKDPFFPDSVRRLVSPVQTVHTNIGPNVDLVLDGLRLKGISGTREERLAIINNCTIAVGESGDVRVPGGRVVKVKCREIRDHSVLVEIAGVSEVRELKLRAGVF